MQGRVDGQCSGFDMGYSIVTFPSHLHIYFCFVLNPACSFGRAGILWSVCSTVSGKAPATGLSWSRARRQKGAAFSIQLRESPRLFLLLWDIWTILRQLQTVGFPLVCSQSFRSNCQQTKTKDNTRVWMLLRNKPCIRTGTILYLTKGKSLFFHVLHQLYVCKFHLFSNTRKISAPSVRLGRHILYLEICHH